MRFFRFACFLFSLLTFSSASTFLEAMDVLHFGRMATDLPSPENLVSGQLDNGLSYFILPHDEPPNRCSIRLLVGVGSLMEKENERGLAHFLEHLAFCGSNHYSRGDLIEELQRLGVKFGAHSNAFTSFSETVYKLDLPDCKEETLSTGLGVFGDYLSGLTLEEGEINRERGVILSEMMVGNSPQFRDTIHCFAFLFPETNVSRRFPIGTKETVENLTRDQIFRFYQRFYGPHTAAVIVVGKVNPTAVIEQLKKIFSPIDSGARPNPTVLGADFASKNSGSVVYDVHQENELPQSQITIFALTPLQDFHDDQATRREELLAKMGEFLLTNRFEKIARSSTAKISSGSATSYNCFRNGVKVAATTVVCRPEMHQLTGAVQLLEQELRRALQYGFTDYEFDVARKFFLEEYRTDAERELTEKNAVLADRFASNLAFNEAITTAEWNLQFVQAVLAQATKEDVFEAFCRLWEGKKRLVYASGKDLPKQFSKRFLRQTYLGSQRINLKAPVNQDRASFGYEDFGQPGEVYERYQPLENIPVVCFRWSNGLRLNFLRTDFNQGEVLLRVRLGRGLMSEPEEKLGLHSIFSRAFFSGGLGKHNIDEWQEILADRTCALHFSVLDNHFLVSGQTRTKDFLKECTLLAAYLTDPGYREEGTVAARNLLDQLKIELENTVEGIYANQGARFLHGGDRRYGYESIDLLKSYDMNDLRGWVQDELLHGYGEMTVVGDIDEQSVVDAVSRTLAALPTRVSTPLVERPTMKFPSGETADFEYQTDIPKGLVTIFWPTVDDRNWLLRRKLDFLSEVLQDRIRLRLRKELGETYSPRAGHVSSYAFDGYGYLYGTAYVKPEDVYNVAYYMDDLARDLRENGINEDEFERIKRPLLVQIQEKMRKNNFWVAALDDLQSEPVALDYLRTLKTFYSNLQRSDLDEVLPFLNPSKRGFLRIKPHLVEKNEKK